MLEELHVRDLALIREAWIELGPGLNVLSGETGAGKTVLIGALQLLVGERADSTAVRSGATESLVEGRFVLAGDERTARRRLSTEGRSKCYLDDGMSSVGELAAELGPLVDLHGQHDHQALLRPAAHVEYLLRFAGETAAQAQEAYGAAFRESAEARSRLQELDAALADRDRRADLLGYQVKEIESAAPTPDEDATLEERLPRMRHAGRLSEAAQEAYRALRDEGGADDGLARALASLETVRGVDPGLDELVDRVQSAATALDEAGADLRAYGEGLEHDPRALDEIEGRLALLADLKRKYGPALSDVLETRDRAAAELTVLSEGEERRAGCVAEVEKTGRALEDAAERLIDLLREAAPGFVDRLSGACADLAMGAARFDVVIEPQGIDAWTETTPARVEFMFSSSAGDPPRPLAKVASGGEVSRVMLALKSVLGAADRTPVLVFDEIDAGIGGATATAVGSRLAEIAVGRQVVVVTHLAQVAAYADRHLVVTKVDEADGSVTTVDMVAGDARVAELARMLAGSESETGLAHARELLEAVGGEG